MEELTTSNLTMDCTVEMYPPSRLRRRWKLIVTIGLILCSIFNFASSFDISVSSCRSSCHCRRDRPRTRRLRLHSTSSPSSALVNDPHRSPESTFWYSEIRRSFDNETDSLPAVPTLDRHGPLPQGAYTRSPNSLFDPKPSCRIAVSIRDDKELEPETVVQQMHHFIDDGLTSFQIQASLQSDWMEEHIVGRLYQETPPSVLRRCEIITPFVTPTVVNPLSVRKNILSTLARCQSDALDCLQVSYQQSHYLLDVLDYLQDLQREGLVRSITARNFPSQVLREAFDYGFAFDNHEMAINLLDASHYNDEHCLLSHDWNLPMVAASPLAGGFLTERFVNSIVPPWSALQDWHWKHTLIPWGHRRLPSQRVLLWNAYQSQVVQILRDMALKYRVSMASIVLRWTLQQRHIQSTVVSCRFVENESRHKSRPQKLREVFRFALDDEDVERLWRISGQKPELMMTTPYDLLLLEMLEQEEGLLFVPKSKKRNDDTDSSTRKLWL